MFKKIKNKIVCKKFIPAGIYRAVMDLEDKAVVYCSEEVKNAFEAFVSTNVRLRRIVNAKQLELKILTEQKKETRKPTLPPNLRTRDGSETDKEVEE